MGTAAPPQPVKLFIGLLSNHSALFGEAAKSLSDILGPIDMTSPFSPFDHSDYYKEELGERLRRQFLFFKDRISPGDLVEIKGKTNSLEQQWALKTPQGIKRQINIDPGYMNPTKVVLASTKDVAHRIYLAKGIYAEITLIYQFGRFQVLEHTYPDFRNESSLDLFTNVRNQLLRQL